MAPEEQPTVQAALTAAAENIPRLLSTNNENILRCLIDNPNFDDSHVCLLLERKDLPGTLLEEISKRKTGRATYRVQQALAVHPHTPRLIAMRLLRELHVMDLARVSLMPAVSTELRRLAEQRVLVQLPQLTLGQRLMLARRGSGRIVAGLIVEGPEQAARIALDSAFLTESQILKTLDNDSIPTEIIAMVAGHAKWAKLLNVRIALLRLSQIPARWVPALASELPRQAIKDLLEDSGLSSAVRAHLCAVKK